jgi:hypothetical protein
MLKFKSDIGKPIVLDCSSYPGPTKTQWATFLWLLERRVLSDTLQLCGLDGLTTVLNNNTVKEQNAFLNQLTPTEQCNLRLHILGCQGELT